MLAGRTAAVPSESGGLAIGSNQASIRIIGRDGNAQAI